MKRRTNERDRKSFPFVPFFFARSARSQRSRRRRRMGLLFNKNSLSLCCSRLKEVQPLQALGSQLGRSDLVPIRRLDSRWSLSSWHWRREHLGSRSTSSRARRRRARLVAAAATAAAATAKKLDDDKLNDTLPRRRRRQRRIALVAAAWSGRNCRPRARLGERSATANERLASALEKLNANLARSLVSGRNKCNAIRSESADSIQRLSGSDSLLLVCVCVNCTLNQSERTWDS